MSPFWTVVIYAAVPAAAVSGGGLLAEVLCLSKRALSLALHAVAGIVLALVAMELLPESIHSLPPWLSILSFIGGGLAFMLIDYLTDTVNEIAGGEEQLRGPLVLFAGVAVDSITDGLMIGTGSTVRLGLGLLLSAGIALMNLPEGFATMAILKSRDMPRSSRIWGSLILGILLIIPAILGYWLLRDEPHWAKMVLLLVTAGLLATLMIEEITPQAHERGDARVAAAVFVGGFAAFALLSFYVE